MTLLQPSQQDRRKISGSPRIILVEDDQILRNSIADYLALVGFDVTAVGTGLKFYHALSEGAFAAAVIDLGLPDIDGMQLVEYIRHNTDTTCVILTARDSVDARVDGYDAGADLYMIKPVESRELASALFGMLQRRSNDSASKESRGKWRLNRQDTTLITPLFSIIPLTSREMGFLLSLAVSPENAIPRETILTALKYADDDMANRALESLIRRLRRKIERSCGTSPILTSYGIGYSFSAPLFVQ